MTIFNRGSRPNPWPQDVNAVVGDRRDSDALAPLAAREFDAIVDFCAYTASDTCALLETLGAVQRLIHISSGTVYSLDPHLPWSELTPYGPATVFGDYARGKIECEKTLRTARSSEGATIALRFPWVLGPRSYADRERFVFNRILDEAEVLLPGDGQAVVQFLSAKQAAETVVAAVERFDDGGWQPFNVASPGFSSLEGFVRICATIIGIEPRIRPVGGRSTGTGAPVFDMRNCVFPYPNVNYVLDIARSEQVGIAPSPVALEETLQVSFAELESHVELRRWTRTQAEQWALAQNRSR